MTVPGPPPVAEEGIRGRLRAQVRSEVKAAGLRMLAQGGPQAISVNAIARELGVSGPALYRYFTSRDQLLADLVEDAYRDFYESLARANDEARDRRPRTRLHALALTYRRWAVAEPHRYRLLFRAPVPGFDAQDARLVHAAQPAMDLLIDALTGSPHAAASVLPAPLESQFDQWAASRGRPGLSPTVARQAVSVWAHLHGLVSLEIEGNLTSMRLEPSLLYEAEVAQLLDQHLG